MVEAYKLLGGDIASVSEVDETSEEERIVEGYITDGLVDTYGHMIDEGAMMLAIQEWMKWGNVRDMHGEPVGTAVEIGTKAWNYIKAKIVDDGAWNRAKNNIYKGFSVGILVLGGEFVPARGIPQEKFAGLSQQVVDAIMAFGEIFKITKLELVEVSIVDRPANPRARVLSVKSYMQDGSFLPSVIGDGGLALKTLYANTGETNTMETQENLIAPAAEEALAEIVEIAENADENKEMVPDEEEAVIVEAADATGEESQEQAGAEREQGASVEALKALEARVEELSASMSALVSLVDKFVTVDQDEPVESGEPAEPQSVSLSLTDTDLEKLADLVGEKFISIRRSLVVGEIESEPTEPEPINYKSLKLPELRKALALNVASNISTRR